MLKVGSLGLFLCHVCIVEYQADYSNCQLHNTRISGQRRVTHKPIILTTASGTESHLIQIFSVAKQLQRGERIFCISSYQALTDGYWSVNFCAKRANLYTKMLPANERLPCKIFNFYVFVTHKTRMSFCAYFMFCSLRVNFSFAKLLDFASKIKIKIHLEDDIWR